MKQVSSKRNNSLGQQDSAVDILLDAWQIGNSGFRFLPAFTGEAMEHQTWSPL